MMEPGISFVGRLTLKMAFEWLVQVGVGIFSECKRVTWMMIMQGCHTVTLFLSNCILR